MNDGNPTHQMLDSDLIEAGLRQESALTVSTGDNGSGAGASVRNDVVERQQLRVLRLREDAVLPAPGSTLAAGLDLYACLDEPIQLRRGEHRLISTGWAVEVPTDCYARVAPRSGMSVKGFWVGAGVVDSDYRGEVKVLLTYLGEENYSQVINSGDRIAQLVVERVRLMQPVEVSVFSETDRGAGGFGSTGA